MPARSSTKPRAALINSSAYHALLDEDDENHATATAIVQGLLAARTRVFTTNFLVAESHALLPWGIWGVPWPAGS